MRNAETISAIVAYERDRVRVRHRGPVAGLSEGYRYRLRPFAHVRATPRAPLHLAQDPGVRYVYEDLPVHALLDVSVPHLGVPALWSEGLDGKGVRIAVVDTGIDGEHPDFRGRVAETVSFCLEDVTDLNGHGTHCAGVAAGTGAASEGRYRGVAPGATLYIAKVLGSDGNGMMSDVMAGIEWAVDRDVQVISLSLGGPGPCDGTDALSQMCDAAVEAGVVVCVAAGNDGPRARTIGMPGGAERALCIGAASNVDTVALFSSRGPTADGRVKPDVLFPGVDIVAARSRGTLMGAPVNTHYTAASGTSMATPHAAGLCALILQAEPSLRPDEIKARMLDAALDLGEEPNAQGAGRVDGWRAVHADGEIEPPEPPPPPQEPPDTGPGCAVSLVSAILGRRKAG
jgi:serine protease AprX